MAITLYISNILLFIVIGICEAMLWDDNVNRISPRKARLLHFPLVAIRGIWFAAVYFITDKDFSSVTNLILCYPMWHLGSMYWMRNYLNPQIYKHKFFDVASSTSTSVMDRLLPLTFGLRLTMFILGTAFYILWNLWI